MAKQPPPVDAITGFLSRAASLKASIDAAIAAESACASLAVFWLDLDRFRQINESFGHAGGDRIIEQIARRMRTVLPRQCGLIRMGSDEFVALVPAVNQLIATRLAAQLLAEIERPVVVDGVSMRPSVSMGVAFRASGEDPSALLERADRAMMEAKRRGGDQIALSGEEFVAAALSPELAREELVIEADLHYALQHGGLLLHYQPIVRLDGSVAAVEALMRCHLPGRALEPGKFIPVAEKSGLIVRLGDWSLVEGARSAAKLQDLGFSAKVAINVSRAQLASPCFAEALQAALICADVPAERIKLELTESLFLDLSPTVQANLSRARNIGVAMSIDDFGTGYSCLANIKDLPVSELKLDRSFVQGLPTDPRAYAVVKAIVVLAQELGMDVVAEGVETLEQQAELVRAGVRLFQGFLHARPIPEEALLVWLREGHRDDD